jgi:hypothetical protein
MAKGLVAPGRIRPPSLRSFTCCTTRQHFFSSLTHLLVELSRESSRPKPEASERIVWQHTRNFGRGTRFGQGIVCMMFCHFNGDFRRDFLPPAMNRPNCFHQFLP